MWVRVLPGEPLGQHYGAREDSAGRAPPGATSEWPVSRFGIGMHHRAWDSLLPHRRCDTLWLGGDGLGGQALDTLRGEVADSIIGSIFLFVGLAACGIAGIRRQKRTRIFAWLGIWSAMYGTVLLSQSQPLLAVSPSWVQSSAP